MDDDPFFPKLGRDIQTWSELDSWVPILDLDIELFKRRNVTIASLIILAAILKANKPQREKLLDRLTPQHFDPKLLPKYLFEKIVLYLQENESVPISEMEKWIPEFSIEVWGEIPSERSLFGRHLTLRQILSFNPTEDQVNRAIELREMVRDKRGYT
jgi:hypothetical protein